MFLVPYFAAGVAASFAARCSDNLQLGLAVGTALFAVIWVVESSCEKIILTLNNQKPDDTEVSTR